MAGDFQDRDMATGVGITAIVAAAARAVETNRARGMICDPFAEGFVKAARSPMPTRLDNKTGSISPSDQRWDNIATGMGIRSRYFDDFFTDACAAGCSQGVLLAAGLDTRAFRMDWPLGFKMFEIDQADVLQFKQKVLSDNSPQPRCTRIAVPVDLRNDWTQALQQAGFDSTQPTSWLAEGLLNYLPPAAERNLFDAVIRLSAPGSCFAANYFTAAMLGGLERSQSIAQFGFDLMGLLHSQSEMDPPGYFTNKGWSVAADSRFSLARRYRRNDYLVMPVKTDVVGRCFTANLLR